MHADYELRQKILKSGLPERFAQKLAADLDFLLSCHIPGLNAVILFGSCARGQTRPCSDVDLLVLTDDALDRSIKGEISSHLEEPVDEVSTDIKFYQTNTFYTSDCRFVSEVKKDGIILWRRQLNEL